MRPIETTEEQLDTIFNIHYKGVFFPYAKGFAPLTMAVVL